MWKHFISDYLSFSKKERTGILVLILLIGCFMGLPFLYPLFIKPLPVNAKVFEKLISSISIKQADEKRQFDSLKDEGKYKLRTHASFGSRNEKFELFYFDPNTASMDDWKKLGVRHKTIATIKRYLSKGGRFNKKEDIGKIWGLHPDEVERLVPFVQIKTTKAVHFPDKKEYTKEPTRTAIHLATPVDVNTADSSAFISLPGIGSKLSQRIIHFREKLGGFYAVEQIGETFGLADSVFQKIKPQLKISSLTLIKININTADIEQMKKHPYLRFAISNAIVQYRLQHGSFSAVEDIRKIMSVTDDIFNKVAPYLTIGRP
jgi:competence ComEA-like helix-hairpin-helix protein